MRVKIRFGKKSDIKDYLKTQKEAFPKTNINREKKFFTEKIKNKEVFIILDNKKYAGHICFGIHKFNPPFAGSIFIEEFAIQKNFRGKSLGTILIKKLLNYCKINRIKEIILGTGDYKKNKAIKWYKKMGFKKVGEHWGLEDSDDSSGYDYDQIFLAIKIKDFKLK